MTSVVFHPKTLPSSPALWLQTARQAALEHFITAGFPHKRQEAWKYTSLSHLKPEIFLPSTPSSYPASSIAIRHGLSDAHQIICLDGQMIIPPALSSFLKPLSEVYSDTSSEHGRILRSLTASSTPINTTGITALNNAYSNSGYVLVLPTDYQLNTPIDIHYIQQTATCYTQSFVFLSSNSRTTIVEHFYGSDSTALYQHHISRIQLDVSAQLQHYRLQHMPLSCTHLYTQDTQLASNAHYSHWSLNTGSKLARHELSTSLNGRKSRCSTHSITLGKENQHLDTYLPVHHTAPQAYSDQHIRQVLQDEAQGIFYGNVSINPHCPQSEAHQLCHSMLLANKAQALVRPELDILTDDVICSHGATVGALNEDALYYLQSRGLDKEQASALLLEAFVQQIIETIPQPAIADILQDNIHNWSHPL